MKIKNERLKPIYLMNLIFLILNDTIYKTNTILYILHNYCIFMSDSKKHI